MFLKPKKNVKYFIIKKIKYIIYYKVENCSGLAVSGSTIFSLHVITVDREIHYHSYSHMINIYIINIKNEHKNLRQKFFLVFLQGIRHIIINRDTTEFRIFWVSPANHGGTNKLLKLKCCAIAQINGSLYYVWWCTMKL